MAQCWSRGRQSNVAEHTKLPNLFMVRSEASSSKGSVWIVDSGFWNHMTGEQELFHVMVKLQGETVRLGDNKQL